MKPPQFAVALQVPAVLQSGSVMEPSKAHPQSSPDPPPGDRTAKAMFHAARRGWEPPSLEELQRSFHQFEIRSVLGRGGMGAVYLGWQKSLDRLVAIKILPPGIEDGAANFAERFVQEAKAMARFKHPGIVAVHDAGETADGLLYFVMEYVDGTDLQRLLAAEKKLPPAQALRIASSVCDALAYAHERGVVHRDIKPSNIMLERDGTVKVADFGLAKLSANPGLCTASNLALGTPQFVAPEQVRGEADHRADLYALGVMLYLMLTGELPRGRFVPPSRVVPGLGKRLDGIVDRALQPDRDVRFSSAKELRAALASVPAARKHRGRTTVLTAMAAAALVVIGVLAFQRTQPRSRDAASSPHNPTVTPRSSGPVTPLGSGIPPPPGPQSFLPVGAVRLLDGGNPYSSNLAIRNGVLAFHGVGYPTNSPSSRDVILRATMRMAAGSDPALSVRTRTSFSDKSFTDRYRLQMDTATRRVSIYLDLRNQSSLLGSWPWPRAYRADEWVRVEFRAFGDELSVLLDQQLVGTIRDTSLYSYGGVFIFGKSGAWLYDIVYEPVDRMPARTPAPRPRPKDAGWRDIIGLIDPARDAVRGQWKIENGALVCATRTPWAFCTIPVTEPAGDYEVRYRVTRGEGSHAAMFFLFRKGDRGGYVVMDYYNQRAFDDSLRRTGLECITPTNLFDPGGICVTRDQWLPKDQLKTVHVRVDQHSVHLNLEHQQIFRWVADWTKLRQTGGVGAEMFQGTDGQPKFGVGIFNCAAVFHSIEIRDITYEEGPKPPSTPAPKNDGVPLGSRPTPTRPGTNGVSTATKEKPFINSLGMQFRPVPIKGGPSDGQRGSPQGTGQPLVPGAAASVLFSVWETRVQDYEVFATETKRLWYKPTEAREPTHPAGNITWSDARAFCDWLTARERSAGSIGPAERYRLPSDHEWSCAVGIGERETATDSPMEKSGRITGEYPWGTTWPPPGDAGNYCGQEWASRRLWVGQMHLANYKDPFVNAAPVGSFAANPLGLLDLGGNMAEWCEDLLDPTRKMRVLRGAPFDHGDPALLPSSARDGQLDGKRFVSAGFRVVLASD